MTIIDMQAARNSRAGETQIDAYSVAANDVKSQYRSEKSAEVPRFSGKMADLTREEIDAKLALAEARAETRFVELSAKSDRIADAINRIASDNAKNNAEIRADNKFTRTTILAAVIGSVIAGLAALWVTQSNMLASFQLGISLHETGSPSSK
jgi:hypothetical protein